MEQGRHNIQPEGFDVNHVSYLLESAALAEEGGNSRLAIHLYCAAFEASQENEEGVDERTLRGLRQAWTLACQQGDRATAETIFNDLAPYNSAEQTQAALAELQEMAMGQLGVKKEELQDMAIAFADEMRDAGVDIEALAEHFEGLQDLPLDKIDFDTVAAFLGDSLGGELSQTGGAGTLETPDTIDGEVAQQKMPFELRYASLAGFEHAKERMRRYGIIDPTDTEMRGFLQQAESFHGLSGPVLNQNFLFVGASREDSGIFAQATANEIGWPVVTMIVDVNEMGDGTIKVMAPVRRTFFGPPRITDLPNPCTVVIQNIDILQDMFWGEEQAISGGQGPLGFRHSEDFPKPPGSGNGIPFGSSPQGMPGQHGPQGAHGFQQRSLQHEITGYLGALFARGGVFVIATSASSSAEQPLVLSEHLEGLLGKLAEINVDLPTLEERQRVLVSFAKDHPSFHDLDPATLARLCEGMSRYDIYMSCRQAVEFAYSESLKAQRHQMVSLEDVLTQFSHCLLQDSTAYRLVEDYLVASFTADLETEMLHVGINPDQIKLDLEDEKGDILGDEE